MASNEEKKEPRAIESISIPKAKTVDGVGFYVVRISGADGTWLCLKRYSQFETFQQNLHAAHPRTPIPPGSELPPKRFSFLQTASFIEDRRILLENFCRKLLAVDNYAAGECFVTFFSTDRHEDESVKKIEADTSDAKLPNDVEITGVTIPSTRIMSDHVLYQIDVENNKKRSSYSRWTVLKRYGQIFEMDALVRVEFAENPTLLAQMPDLPARQNKLLVGHMESSFVEQRRVLLENYFERMLRILPIVRNETFLSFLGVMG
jgi:hypothetical protein